MVVFDYTTSDEEFDMDEDEDVAMLLMMHHEANKRPKHGGSVMGREHIRRQRQEAHAKLMANYFMEIPVYPERYFCRRFRMSCDFFRHIASVCSCTTGSLRSGGIVPESLYIASTRRSPPHCARWLMVFLQILWMITWP